MLTLQLNDTGVAGRSDRLFVGVIMLGTVAANDCGYRPGPLVLDPNSGVKSEHSIAKLQQWMRESVDD